MSTFTSTDVSPERWVANLKTDSNSWLRLVCFPYAGGGVAQFQPWGDLLPAGVELCVVRLPGRESRLNEPPAENLLTVAATVAQALNPLLDRTTAFFGHSLGALLAFETIRHLRRLGQTVPVHFFASGRAAPHVGQTDSPIHNLTQPELVAEIGRRYDGIPRAVLDEPSLLELLLPMLRGDLKMVETYVYRSDEPLPCPITAFGGTTDPRVPVELLDGWADHTTDRFHVETFAGGHFYLQAERPALIESILRDLHEDGLRG